MSKDELDIILTNTITLCERCNVVDKVKDGSFHEVKLPKNAKYIRHLVFYGHPTQEIKEPYSLHYELYSEGFHENRTTYFYDIPVSNPTKGFEMCQDVNIKLWDDSPESQFIHGVYPAERVCPYENGTVLTFYVQGSKEIKGLELRIGVKYE